MQSNQNDWLHFYPVEILKQNPKNKMTNSADNKNTIKKKSA